MSELPWKSIHLDRDKLTSLVTTARKVDMAYKLGAKPPSLSTVPGTHGFASCDCSGWVRLCVYQASGGLYKMVDGSVNQHDQIEKDGFKQSDMASCSLKDNRVRIAFLPPEYEGVGHVCLVLNAETIESCGGIGPTRRAWDTAAHPWMSHVVVYVLDLSTGGAG